MLCHFVLGNFEGCASADRYVMLGLYLIALRAEYQLTVMLCQLYAWLLWGLSISWQVCYVRFVLGCSEGWASADGYVMLGLYLVALIAAGRIKSTKNPDDLAGNRHRSLAAFSAVHQPTAPQPPVPPYVTIRLVNTLCSTGFFFRKLNVILTTSVDLGNICWRAECCFFNFYTHFIFEFSSRAQATKTVICLKFVWSSFFVSSAEPALSIGIYLVLLHQILNATLSLTFPAYEQLLAVLLAASCNICHLLIPYL